jgi:acid phosphatase type 7
MMRQSQTIRSARRLLLSHPIVCLLAAVAAVVLLGVLGPIKVVHAADPSSVEGENFDRPASGTNLITGAGYSSGAALKFTGDRTATSPTVTCSATCDVVLMASGGQNGGQATFSVKASSAAGDFTAPPQTLASASISAYTFDLNLPADSYTISVTAGGTGPGHNAILDVTNFPADGGTQPQCSDTRDNDNDGKIDYPADPGCLAPTDNDETDQVTFHLVGAGDIGHGVTKNAPGDADVATGNLIETLIKAQPEATTVFTAGDNAYPDGTYDNYLQEYQPAWGDFKLKTKPSPGNHEYSMSTDASGYKTYFGSLATPEGTTYYAYDLGDWRIYSLDSAIAAGRTSPQYQWLQNDLAANARTCMAAYWHHPIASSGVVGNMARMGKIFALLDSKGADLVLSGHDHDYERFTNINSSGAVDPNGMREIVVGTGGAPLGREVSVQPGSEVRNFDTHGIVDITLSSTGYSGEFVPAPGFGSFTDSFSGTCGT